MPQYRVLLERTVTEEVFVEVQATSFGDAQEVAERVARNGDVDWDSSEVTGADLSTRSVEYLGS